MIMKSIWVLYSTHCTIFCSFLIISIGTGTVFIYSYWHLKNEVNTNIYSSTETLIY